MFTSGVFKWDVHNFLDVLMSGKLDQVTFTNENWHAGYSWTRKRLHWFCILCTFLSNAVATRIDFLVRGVAWRRWAFRGLKTSSKEIWTLILSDFLWPGVLPVSWKTPIRTQDEEIGRVVRHVVHVVRRVQFPRPRSLDNTSDEKVGACSHDIRSPRVIERLTDGWVGL